MAEIETVSRIDTLLKTATSDAANALLEIADGAANKEEKKAAKRALYLLSQKGIAPDAPANAAPPAALSSSAPDTLEFFMSGIDGAGNQLLCFVLPEPDGGRPLLMTMIAVDDEGITHFSASKTPRSEIDAQLRSMDPTYGSSLAPMPADYGRWLVAQRRETNRKNFKPTPTGFMEALPRIGEPQQQRDAMPLDDLPSAEAILADENYPRDAAALFGKPGFERWFLNMALILPELPRWAKIMLEKSDDGPEEIQNKRQALLREITANVMTETECNRYADRLQTCAMVLWKNAQGETAKQALYHAQELRSNQAEQESFAFALVQRTMEAAHALLINAMQEKNEVK